MKLFKRFTVDEIWKAVMDEAKKDKEWSENQDILDYAISATATSDRVLDPDKEDFSGYRCCISEVDYGSSEGIYADIVLILTADGHPKRVPLGTMKTLDSDRNAFLKMYLLSGLVCYLVNQFLAIHEYSFEKGTDQYIRIMDTVSYNSKFYSLTELVKGHFVCHSINRRPFVDLPEEPDCEKKLEIVEKALRYYSEDLTEQALNELETLKKQVITAALQQGGNYAANLEREAN